MCSLTPPDTPSVFSSVLSSELGHPHLPLFVYEWPVFHRTPFRSGQADGADPAALGSGQGGHVASSRWSDRAMKMAKVGDLLVL
jgi:hypothetical protein